MTTALPAVSDFTGSSITEAQFKQAITDLRTHLADLLGVTGTQAAALAALGAVMNGKADKAAAYTVIGTDRGKVINSTTGTWTLSLTAAATLGDGFSVAVLNSGSGTITIDPDGAEQIDGAATKAILPGKLVVVYCDGAKFTSVASQTPEEVIAQIYGTLAAGTIYSKLDENLFGNYSSAWVEIGTAKTCAAGVLRVKFNMEYIGGAGGTVSARIYKNGVPYGTTRSRTSGSATYTEDLEFAAGDLIQIYSYGSAAYVATAFITKWEIGVASLPNIPFLMLLAP